MKKLSFVSLNGEQCQDHRYASDDNKRGIGRLAYRSAVNILVRVLFLAYIVRCCIGMDFCLVLLSGVVTRRIEAGPHSTDVDGSHTAHRQRAPREKREGNRLLGGFASLSVRRR